MRAHPATLVAITGPLLLVTACLDHPLKPVEYEGSSEDRKTLEVTNNRNVDVLFVMDNSGSMGEEQGKLAQNFDAFIDVLEEVDANYRIGVTTTDNGNPGCAGTSPEAGAMVFQSCRDRLSQFTSQTGVNKVDEACLEVCDYGDGELEHLPTRIAGSNQTKPRPWLENIEGRSNVALPADAPEEAGMAEAFACYGPQGIAGCGFESHLESMYKALARTQNPGEASHGFIRDDALLSIIHVTDEADCSYREQFATIFEGDGNRVFWEDPDASFPTSAVCWNAGVECTGDPSDYDCTAVDKDVDGNVTDDSDEAVLHPLSRYVDFVQAFEDSKSLAGPTKDVIVGLIGGVDGSGDPSYADAGQIDPQFQEDFGIGWGCSSDGLAQRAVPPVRLAEFTEHFTTDNMHSVCEDDYSVALARIAGTLEEQFEPACYRDCVADFDASTDVLEPDCVIEEVVPGEDGATELTECARDDQGYLFEDGDYVLPGDEADACFVYLVDADGSHTPDAHDDMTVHEGERFCASEGFNLEVVIKRRFGAPATAGTVVNATCALSQFPQTECPSD